MVTIMDVARRAEVSRATVSRVVNGDPTVQPALRRVVKQAMEELGYVPNLAARALRMQRTKTIGSVVSDLTNPVFLPLIQGAEEALRQRGYSLLLCDSQTSPEMEAANLRHLYERRVDGLTVHSTGGWCQELDLFAQAGTPMLVVQELDPAETRPGMIAIADEGIGAITAHLWRFGHRRIAFVTGDRRPYGRRAQRFAREMADLGMDAGGYHSVRCASEEACREATLDLLGQASPPTAIISGVHVFAPVILGAIRDAGFSVPDDVSFATLGDTPWAAVHCPPVTATAFPYAELGKASAEYLLSLIDGGDPAAPLPPSLSRISATLVIRQSCGPPRAETVGEAGRRPARETGG